MKTKTPAIVLLTALCLVSCQHGKNAAADAIVKTTVTNADGTRLDMVYNNTRHTSRYILNGDTIDMKQDTMASGIRYSNSRYEYAEWHGQITLKKDGKVIFSHGF